MYERKVLVRWMEKKAELLGCPEYFTEEDRKELEEWDEDVVKEVFNEMDLRLSGEALGDQEPFPLDSEACPWCVYATILRPYGCKSCDYGERHGKCLREGSTYSKIVRVSGDGSLMRTVLKNRPIGKRNIFTLWEETKREVKGGNDEI